MRPEIRKLRTQARRKQVLLVVFGAIAAAFVAFMLGDIGS